MARAKKETVDKNSPSYLAMQIRNARAVILTILLCTLVNIILLLLETNTYFLFSASVPYYGTALAMIYDGNRVGTYAMTALLVSAVILAAYLLCWYLAKKGNKSLTVALVLFVVDTVALAVFAFTVMENPAGALLDFAFHGLGVYELAMGVISAAKLKKLPPEQAIPNINDVLMS